MITLGQRLKIAREKSGMSQLAAAKKVGISNGTLSGYERNYRDPDTKTLQKLANLYGVSLDWLLNSNEKNNFLVKEKATPYYALNEKDERDIAKDLEKMMEDLDSDTALAFHGEPMDEETRRLVSIALENSMRLAKEMAKKKFTPKKYRNEEDE